MVFHLFDIKLSAHSIREKLLRTTVGEASNRFTKTYLALDMLKTGLLRIWPKKARAFAFHALGIVAHVSHLYMGIKQRANTVAFWAAIGGRKCVQLPID